MKPLAHFFSVALLSMTAGVQAHAQTPANFDASRIVNTTDTFTLLMQGNSIGSMKTSHMVAAGVVTGKVELGLAFQGMTQNIDAEVRFHVDGPDMISSSQIVEVAMTRAETDIEYGNGRVTGIGQSRGQGPGGVLTTTEIDTVAGADVIDSGAMNMLLGTLDWTEGAVFSYKVFQGPSGSVHEAIAAVEGSETLTVPQGTYETWRINVTGVLRPVRLWFAKDTGQLIKLAGHGQPVEIVLGAPAGLGGPTD